MPGQFQRDRFNYNLVEHMDGWLEFVEAHYYYSRRRDNPFWRHVSDGVEYSIKGTHEVIQYMMVNNGYTSMDDPHGPSGHRSNVILTGSGYTNVNKRLYDYFGYPPLVTQRKVDLWKDKWTQVKRYGETCPPMSVFLESTFDYG